MNTSETLKQKKHSPAKRDEDGRVLAQENEHAVLAGLAHYGFLSAAQLQALVWPDSKQSRVAQRTLKRLVERKLVQRQFNLQARQVYALTAAGACFTRAALGIEAASTLQALPAAQRSFDHRMLANDMCIRWQVLMGGSATSVFTEYSIQQGTAPIVKKEAHFGKTKGKIPDGLLLLPEFEHPTKGRVVPLAWGEVEMADKWGEDYAHLISEICHVLGGYGKERFELPNPHYARNKITYEVHAVMVACPNEQHQVKLAKSVLERLTTQPWNRHKWDYVKDGVWIWTPGMPSVNLNKWLEQHPDVAAWHADMRREWSDRNFGKD